MKEKDTNVTENVIEMDINNKKEEKPQIITNKTASKEIKRLPVTGM